MSDYPSNLDVRPLTTWPGGALTAAHARRRAPFSAGLTSTLRSLTTELGALHARHPVLEVAIPADQFRIDGRPRANAREDHPGVVLSLPATNVGPLRYSTDRFDRWQDNLRGIALGLEALRKVERYGITKRGEQYQGFKQLGGGAVAVGPAMSVDEAARSLQDLAGGVEAAPAILTDPLARAAAYRVAAKHAHPDRGGSREQWDRLEQAKRALDEHAPVSA